jgi:hypothetical protein
VTALERACADVVAAVDGATGCAVVSLRSGEVLGAHGTRAPIELATIASLTDLARDAAKKKSGAPTFDELLVTTGAASHFAIGVAGALMVVSMPRASNVGMGWVQVRGGIRLVEPHLARES